MRLSRFRATLRHADCSAPLRVRDAPISEEIIVGLAVCSAKMGKRPIVEFMFMAFLCFCLDQIANQGAKMHYL